MLTNADIVKDFQRVGLPTNCYGKFLHLIKEQGKACKSNLLNEIEEDAYKHTIAILETIIKAQPQLVNQIPAWWVVGIIPTETRQTKQTQPLPIFDAVDKLLGTCTPQEAFTIARYLDNWGRMKLQTNVDTSVKGATIAGMLMHGEKQPNITESVRVATLKFLESETARLQGNSAYDLKDYTALIEKVQHLAPEYQMGWVEAEKPSTPQDTMEGIIRLIGHGSHNLHITEKQILFPLIAKFVETRHEPNAPRFWQKLPLFCLERSRDDTFEYILHKSKPTNLEWHETSVDGKSLCDGLLEYTLRTESTSLLQASVDMGLQDGTVPLWKSLFAKLPKGGTKIKLLSEIRNILEPVTKINKDFYNEVPKLPKAYHSSIPRLFSPLLELEQINEQQLESDISLV